VPASSSTLELSPEHSLLLLTCLSALGEEEEKLVRRWVAGALDWELVLWKAETFGTIPLLRFHLNRLGLAADVPAHVRAYLDTWSALAAIRARILGDELVRLALTLDRNRIDYFLVKGAAVAPLYYPEPSIRHMLDIDVMIGQDDFPIVRDLMFQYGYMHGVWMPETNEVIEVLDPVVDLVTHHEFPALQRQITVPNTTGRHDVPEPWKRKHLKLAMSPTAICFNVFVDLHFNLAVGLDLADVWHGVERRTIYGHRIAVQSPTDMTWFIAARLYNETFQHNAKKLIMLGDLHAILRAEHERIDWPRILALAAKYKIGPALFYVLAHLQRLTRVGVPAPVLEALAPDPAGLGEGNDWGDPIPKIMGIHVVHDLCLAE
jgi:hypothetical protein